MLIKFYRSKFGLKLHIRGPFCTQPLDQTIVLADDGVGASLAQSQPFDCSMTAKIKKVKIFSTFIN